MSEPKYNDFEDPKDYHAARAAWLQARVEELEAYVDAPCECCRKREAVDAENKRLREDLDLATEEWGDEEWEILEERRAALKEKP